VQSGDYDVIVPAAQGPRHEGAPRGPSCGEDRVTVPAKQWLIAALICRCSGPSHSKPAFRVIAFFQPAKIGDHGIISALSVKPSDGSGNGGAIQFQL